MCASQEMSAFPSRDILLNPQKLKNVKQKYEKGEFSVNL